MRGSEMHGGAVNCQWSYRYNFMWIDSIPP
jgi:hypothetical protein